MIERFTKSKGEHTISQSSSVESNDKSNLHWFLVTYRCVQPITTKMNTTDMDSNGHVSCPQAVSIFFTVTMAIISSAASIGNILVIAAVYKTPSLRTSANIYYVNMAVSDFLASLAAWPLYLTDEIITSRGSLIQGPLATAGCKIGVFVRLVSSSVSIISLMLIAVDRFIATVYPLKITLLTRRKRAALLFSTWLIAIAQCIPNLYHSRVKNFGQETFCTLAWNASAKTFNYLYCTIFVIALLVAIIYLYSRIMRALRGRLKPESHVAVHKLERRRMKENQNIMRIFKAIVVAYFVCLFPLCVFLILKVAYPQFFSKTSASGLWVFSILSFRRLARQSIRSFYFPLAVIFVMLSRRCAPFFS